VRWWIVIKGNPQHSVQAANAGAALHTWMNEQGYETVGQVAEEYYCSLYDIVIVPDDDGSFDDDDFLL
jgi:hypothetical protein